MKTKANQKTKKAAPDSGMDDREIKSAPVTDLMDSAEDDEKLRGENTVIDLPDVEDIPGQEYIQPPTLESFVDDTISSADEEGPVRKKKKNKKEDISALQDDTDDAAIRRASLDDADDEGDLLNEKSFGDDLSGDDLDIPGSEDDDADEALGEEDEENNSWSLEGEREDEEDQKFE